MGTEYYHTLIEKGGKVIGYGNVITENDWQILGHENNRAICPPEEKWIGYKTIPFPHPTFVRMPLGELEMQNILMKFDPATGEERPYPSHAAQWREWHGGTAWLFDPWTGRRRDARDVGSDVHGLLIVPAGTLGMDMGGGCSEKDNVACA